jgi:hypothetical protein
MPSGYDRAMFTLDQDIPEPLRPLAWLIGRWEGVGLVGYPGVEEAQFGQAVDVTHDGRDFLQWESRSWYLDAETGERTKPFAVESGFWRPLPGGEVELLLAHPTGVLELYYGPVEPARVQLKTDGVLRSPTAGEYNAATRMYGLVESQLFWALDVAAGGHELQNHSSARLKRVE